MIKYGLWNILKERYKLLDEDKSEIMGEILEKIALRNKMFNKGESLNIQQAAYTVLRDYRNCRLSKFGLDK